MLKNTVSLELNKALKNKLFLLALGVGCAITLLNLYEFVLQFYTEQQALLRFEAQGGVHYNRAMHVDTPFGRWIGLEGFSLGSSIYYFVFPLLIAIPYGWSYCAERRSGYEKNMVLRCGKSRYYLAKYIAVFVSGGLTMVIPLVFNFLSLAMFLPLNPPLVNNLIYYGIFPQGLFSVQFYTVPYLYVFLMCLLCFFFCGLLACLCYSAGALIKNRVAVTLVPFAVLILLKYFQQFYFSFVSSPGVEINPLYFLNGQRATTNFWVLGVEGVVLLLATLGVICLRGRKHEIY